MPACSALISSMGSYCSVVFLYCLTNTALFFFCLAFIQSTSPFTLLRLNSISVNLLLIFATVLCDISFAFWSIRFSSVFFQWWYNTTLCRWPRLILHYMYFCLRSYLPLEINSCNFAMVYYSFFCPNFATNTRDSSSFCCTLSIATCRYLCSSLLTTLLSLFLRRLSLA